MTIRVGIVGTGGISRAHHDAPPLLPPEGVLLTNVIMDGIFRSHAAGKEVAVSVPEI